jgi:hypothetical protein
MIFLNHLEMPFSSEIKKHGMKEMQKSTPRWRHFDEHVILNSKTSKLTEGVKLKIFI